MFKNLIAAAHAMIAKAREFTPELQKVVNEVRLAAHMAGQLDPAAEQKFQDLCSRFNGLIVNASKLVPLPPLNAQGLRTDGPTYDQWVKAGRVGAYPPEGYAAVEAQTAEQSQYEAGFQIGLKRGTLLDDATDAAKAGYAAGLSTGQGSPGSSPSPTSPSPTPPEATVEPNPPAPEEQVKSVESETAT